MPRVICTSLNAETGPHWQLLTAGGFQCQCAPRDVDLYTQSVLIDVLQEGDAVIAGAEPYTRETIESLPRLRVIARTGVGYDAIDLAACDEAKIAVCITPGVNHDAVAEHTIAMLMAVARGFPALDQQVRAGIWRRVARPRTMGSVVGLVGLGRIGQAVAWRAAGLGLKVLGCDPLIDRSTLQAAHIELVSLDELLARSDFVSLHLPMSAENRHMINRQSLATMKRGAILINTSRGQLVDEAALVEALRSGQLRGAGLDVFEFEPLPATSHLLSMDNVLLSGHVAGLDRESHDATFTMAAEHILALYRGQWPGDSVVNLRDVKDWKW